MEITFLGAVRMHGIENHAGSSQQVHHRHQETDIAIVEIRNYLEDRWSRKSVGIAAGKLAQEDKAYLPHAMIEQRAPEMYPVTIAGGALAQVTDNPLPLILREPLGVSGTGRQVDQEDDAQHHSGQPLHQETATASRPVRPCPGDQEGLRR